MTLRRLRIDGLRNLREVDLEPHPRLSVFVGANGQGKTTLLEGIYLASALRPLRPLQGSSDLVRHDGSSAHIAVHFDIDGGTDLAVDITAAGRKVRRNDKAIRDPTPWLELQAVVSFVPEDLDFIRGGPAERRRALDRITYSLYPRYGALFRRCEETLTKRNRLLRDEPIDADLLIAYTEPWLDAAAEVTWLRAQALRLLGPHFSAEALAISGGRWHATLVHEASASGGVIIGDDVDVATLRAMLAERLMASGHVERRRGFTTVGPQHDDVLCTFGSDAAQPARFLASQGETRALVLAFKLGCVRALQSQRGVAPLLLLDDVAGELDRSRQQHLLQAIAETGAQTFVTTPHAEALPAIADAAILTVHDGRITTS